MPHLKPPFQEAEDMAFFGNIKVKTISGDLMQDSPQVSSFFSLSNLKIQQKRRFMVISACIYLKIINCDCFLLVRIIGINMLLFLVVQHSGHPS